MTEFTDCQYDYRYAGVKIAGKHIDGPQGVRGRNSNNDKLREVLGWEPQVSLEDGLRTTYNWIEREVKKTLGAKNAAQSAA